MMIHLDDAALANAAVFGAQRSANHACVANTRQRRRLVFERLQKPVVDRRCRARQLVVAVGVDVVVGVGGGAHRSPTHQQRVLGRVERHVAGRAKVGHHAAVKVNEHHHDGERQRLLVKNPVRTSVVDQFALIANCV